MKTGRESRGAIAVDRDCRHPNLEGVGSRLMKTDKNPSPVRLFVSAGHPSAGTTWSCTSERAK